MHEREQQIFQGALALGSGDLPAYLATACAGDEALRRRVEILLHAHNGARQFLERPFLAGPGAGSDALAGVTRDLTGRTSAGGEADGDETEEETLDFLLPTSRADSRGRLAHYEVLEVLGRGGFGTVVRAFDDKLHRMVAIKIMARALAVTSPPRKRFLREARAAAAVRHPHVVAIHAVDEAPVPYLVMEYVAGPTLQAKIDATGPLSPAEVIRIGLQIAEGLAAAHRQGLVHRDIKPANILLEDAAERVKITDFGLARAADDASLTQSGVIAGTPLYMAPEQATGAAIDARADLFSLGSVLYLMATGRPPFRGASTVAVLRRVAEDSARSIREVMPEVPAALCELIDQLHAKDPADRPASADAVAARLRALRDDQRGPQGPRRAAPPPRAAALTPVALDPDFRAEPRRLGKKQPARTRPWLLTTQGAFWMTLVLALAILVATWPAGQDVTPISPPKNPAGDPINDRPTPPTTHRERLVISNLDEGIEVLLTGPNTCLVSPPGPSPREFLVPPGTYTATFRGRNLFYQDKQTVYPGTGGHAQMFIGTRNGIPTAGPEALTTLIDPRGGSVADTVGSRTILSVPGGERRHLNPMVGFNLNAPRFLLPVAGDFSIRVEQRPSPRPGPTDVNPDRRSGVDGYQWAGLVVWSDDRNFLRFGVGRLPEFEAGQPFLDLKLHDNIRMAEEQVEYTAEGATHLRIDRVGAMLYVLTSRNGTDWTLFRACRADWFPRNLQVGLAAINCGTRQFEAKLDGWAMQGSLPLDGAGAVGGTRTTTVPPSMGRDLGLWGRLIDPVGDCAVSQQGGQLEITIPPQVERDLNPRRGFSLTAPRTAREVEGDFVAQVRILPFSGPGQASEGYYRLAGLVIAADEQRFVRFGAADFPAAKRPWAFTDLEYFQGLNPARHDVRHGTPCPPYIRAERHGDSLILKTSADGQTWDLYTTISIAGYPSKVRVGVVAVKAGAKEFAARFADWGLQATGAGGTTTPNEAVLGPWGRLVDPAGGVRATQAGARLTLRLPGDSVRDLNPSGLPGKNLDAPRALQPVTGDFVATVRIPTPPRAGANPEGRTYRFAGLLVWASELDFARFGPYSNGPADDERPPLSLEFFRNRKDIEADLRPGTATPPTYFQVERRGDQLQFRSSRDGQVWMHYDVVEAAGLPSQLQVGVVALNTTPAPYEVQFDQWSLRSDSSLGGDRPTAAVPQPPSAPDLGVWGRFEDPKGGTQAARRGDLLTMTLPPQAPRDLNPGPNTTTDAPRVLRDARGDFRYRVTVRPFAAPRVEASARNDGNVYHWAGPIVWLDSRNFVRFGVGRSTADWGETIITQEFYRAGQPQLYSSRKVENDQQVAFLIERRGDSLRVASSLDGQNWTDAKPCNLAGFPARLGVGVATVNTGLDPLTTTFDGWSLQGSNSVSATDLGAWGRLVDPAGRTEASPFPGGLTLRLPERLPLDLDPTSKFGSNGPRVAQTLDGDFRVRVKLLPFALPESDPAANDRNDDRRWAGHDRRWAGLITWTNEGNLSRFGVGRDRADRGGQPAVHFDFFRNSVRIGAERWPIEEVPTHLELERRGTVLTYRTSPDGQVWTDRQTLDRPNLPQQLQVGLAALNTGDAAFAPTFEDWSLDPQPAEPARR